MPPDAQGAAGALTAGYPAPVIIPPMPPPRGIMGVQQVYGSFRYYELGKGNIDVDDTWERDNIVRLRNVCGTMFNITLHRLVAPLFEDAFRAALAAAPGYQIRMLGGYCPRHKMHDPKRGLSIHSWGAAFDVNWDTNGCGPSTPCDLKDKAPGFIKAFKDRGWVWGGDWEHERDWMHFQYATSI